MRALVLSVGGLRGAYDAVVAAALCRRLGSKYFQAIYACSVGVFAGSFYASNQPDIIENTWTNYVDGNQLVKYSNIVKGKDILNTDYLIDLFRSEKSFIDVEKVFSA